MTIIKGQLAIANINVSVNNWEARGYDAQTGQHLGARDVVSSVYYPADWVLPCGNHLDTTLVTITPQAGRYWAAERETAEDERCVATSTENLFIYKATDAPQALKDTLWDSVIVKMPLNGSIVDEKEHTITEGGDPTTIYTLPFWNPKNSQDEYIGGGYVEFWPGTTPNHLIIDSADVEAGTDDFCIEFWLQALFGDDGSGYVFSIGDPTTSTGFGLQFSYFDGGINVVSNDSVIAFAEFTASTWRYVTLTRSGTTLTLYVDGVSIDTGILSADIAGDLYIGAKAGTSPDQAGCGMLDFRYTLGDPRYTETFSKPEAMQQTYGPASTGATEPEWPVTISSTVIDGDVTWQCMARMVQPITHGWFKPERNAATTDALSASVVLLVPFSSDSWDLKSSTLWRSWPTFAMDYTTPPPSGGYGCGRFSGGTAITDELNYEGLLYDANAACDLGTGDFTIEFWIKVMNATFMGGDYQTPMVFELGWSGASGGIGVQYNGLDEALSVVGNYLYSEIPVEIMEGTTETDWMHVAVSRQSGMLRTFLDGAQIDEQEYTDDLHVDNEFVYRPSFSIGGSIDTQGPFDGYMADVRVTKGTARYWSEFTPPTTRFSD